MSAVAIGVSAEFVIIRVWQFSRVGQSHKMGDVGNETNVYSSIELVISVPKITVIGLPLFKLLLKICSHMSFFETQCSYCVEFQLI